jgi:hypothetical protein
METAEIKCYIWPLGQYYADGLERVELYVCREFIGCISSPPHGERVNVTLVTPRGTYGGGLRTYARTEEPYLCPDLTSKQDGTRVSLAKILENNGINISAGGGRDLVRVKIDGSNWKLLGSG